MDGVTVSFDGFKALNALSFYLEPGELRTIIGPNGAGKTTFMDVITGKTKPDTGSVFYNDTTDLTRMNEVAIANLGIGRKFQRPSVFENITVAENIELSLAGPRRAFGALLAKPSKTERERIDDLLEQVGLAERKNELAGLLSHGQKQWLEIGMLLAQEPKLILLDEPVAGMTDLETERTAELILSIVGERTVVVVEHDMDFVRNLGAKTTVLHEGRVLAEGSVQAVQNDARVVEVYLGR
ncbi:urea ABC transporter ATP-binding protein UrtD [Marinivivus vitaminiproducens]|uniref:urea ABC transporter ATP-binding protein UrtD n=1 Tax=Marinivivus vitaminiproducens TaxID=3035935 RepID=UPI0027A97154|nr:urea ABC transporter ATP-binding protein UrtD [Geminicoccaceae bacterium SCSIO 64248]